MAHTITMPNFIIIGAQRCGTTSLYKYLTKHPNIVPAQRKESHFFDIYFQNGIDWYRAQFPALHTKQLFNLIRLFGGFGKRPQYLVEFVHKIYYTLGVITRNSKEPLITGEASPYYIFHPLSPNRIAQIMPHVKLIVLLRNPVNRAYSQFWHETRGKTEHLPFEEAIKREPERLEGEREKLMNNKIHYSEAHQCHSYLARGIYVEQLKVWHSLFSREQMLILCSEDFYANPPETLNRVLAFLELPSWTLKNYNPYRAGDYPQMNPIIRKQLVDYFRPYNESLYTYLGVDFGWER